MAKPKAKMQASQNTIDQLIWNSFSRALMSPRRKREDMKPRSLMTRFLLSPAGRGRGRSRSDAKVRGCRRMTTSQRLLPPHPNPVPAGERGSDWRFSSRRRSGCLGRLGGGGDVVQARLARRIEAQRLFHDVLHAQGGVHTRLAML